MQLILGAQKAQSPLSRDFCEEVFRRHCGERKTLTAEERIDMFKKEHLAVDFTRADYLKMFKDISSPTASRDLRMAVEHKLLLKKGDKRTTRYRFKK